VNKNSIYQVCTANNEVYVSINGKASYLNCSPLRTFLHKMLQEGNKSFVVDFHHCTSMDSTFLGILVGLALELRKLADQGHLTLVNLIGRNLETVQNLGIHKIAHVSPEFVTNKNQLDSLIPKSEGHQASPDIIYNAHKNLLELNEKNSRLFNDVVLFLEQKLEDSS
jgi:anti-anti-sigma regulatory factor